MDFRRLSAVAAGAFVAIIAIIAAATSAFGLIAVPAAETLKAPVVKTQPKSLSTQVGVPASFTSLATGTPTPSVQWQSSTNGTTWTNVAGATSSTYTVASPALAESGTQFRAVFSNSQGTAISSAATMTVVEKPTVTLQPAEVTVTAGQSAKFESAATGTPTPTVQWQSSSNGGSTWASVSGATSPTLTLTNVLLAANGKLYRAVWTNSGGEAISQPAKLNVQSVPAVTTQPSSSTVEAGQPASFTVAGTGTPTPSVQWQATTNGGVTWTNIEGATSTTYTIPATSAEENGRQLRAVLTNGAGSATSSAATLTVREKPTVTLQPVEATSVVGQAAVFESAASGLPAPTVHWEVSTNGGTSWAALAGATSAKLTLSAVSAGMPNSGPTDAAIESTTSFGNYEFRADAPGYEPLYGILPLKFNGGYLALDILFFAPAAFFNLREVYPFYEFDLDKKNVRYKIKPEDEWSTAVPLQAEELRAKRALPPNKP